MTINQESIIEAQEYLSASVDSMENRISRIDDELSSLRSRRRIVLTDHISTYLSDFSSHTLILLKKTFPKFATFDVITIFEHNKKFLGLFWRSGSRSELAALQTRFTKFMIEENVNGIAEIDRQISELSEEKTKVARMQNDALELLKFMSKNDKYSTQIPDEVQILIQSIADNGARLKRLNGGRYAEKRIHYDSAPSSNIDNYDDWWLYGFTGIPTSSRTLMMSFIQSQSSQNHSQHENPDSFNDHNSTVSTVDSQMNCIPLQTATLIDSPICKDDSLGRYS